MTDFKSTVEDAFTEFTPAEGVYQYHDGSKVDVYTVRVEAKDAILTAHEADLKRGAIEARIEELEWALEKAFLVRMGLNTAEDQNVALNNRLAELRAELGDK